MTTKGENGSCKLHSAPESVSLVENGRFVIKIYLKGFCTTVYRILAPLTCLLAEILPLTPVPLTKTGRFLHLLQNIPTMSNSIHTVSSSTKYILYSLRSRRIKGRGWGGRREFRKINIGVGQLFPTFDAQVPVRGKLMIV